jgi:transposase
VLESLTMILKSLARRWAALAEELKMLDHTLEKMTTNHAKRLRKKFGISP